MSKIDILAIGVHPDDVELGCGATILKQVDRGNTVGILDLTLGELGTRGSAELRMIEAEKAKNYCGAQFRENLELEDGMFEINKENKLKIVRIIRRYRPEIVLSNAIRDRHPDHGKAAQLINDACFLSGLEKVKTEIEGHNQEKWRPRKILNYIQDHHIDPDIVIDVSGYMEKKIELIKCFDSQFYNPESTEGDTPISTATFFEFLKGRAIAHGRQIGANYGEGFTCNTYIGVDELMKIL